MNTATLMEIAIKEGQAGMFFATSEDDPTFFVSAMSMGELWSTIPVALAHVFKERHNVDVFALPTNKGEMGHKSWTIVPRELVPQQLAHVGC